MAIDRSIKAGRAFIELFLDDTAAIRSLRTFGRRFQVVGRQIAAIGAVGVGIGAGVIAAGFVPAIKLASDYAETLSKFKVVYRDLADGQKRWVENFSADVGRSRLELTSFAAQFQDLLVPIGIDRAAAAETSKTLVQLTLDLASFNNATDAEAAGRLRAALTGSGEVLKDYGVILNETTTKQRLLLQGIDPKNATEAQKVFARLSIIMSDTADAQGDAIRTADGFANQMKRIKGQVTDAAVEIGTALLPALTRVAQTLSGYVEPVAKFIRGNQQIVVAAGVGVASLTALSGVAVAAGAGLTVLGTAATAVATVVGVLGAPITAVAIAAGVATAAVFDWKGAFEDLTRFINGDLVPSLNSIGTLIESQDFSLAGELLMLTLEAGIVKGIGRIKDKFADAVRELTGFDLQQFSRGDAEPVNNLLPVLGIDLADIEKRRQALLFLAEQKRLISDQDALEEEQRQKRAASNAAAVTAPVSSALDASTSKATNAAAKIADQLKAASIDNVVSQAEEARRIFEASFDDIDKRIASAAGITIESSPETQQQLAALKAERERIERGVFLAQRKLITDEQDPNFRGIEFLVESAERIERAKGRLTEIGEEIAELNRQADPLGQFEKMIESLQAGAETAFQRIRLSGTNEGAIAERIGSGESDASRLRTIAQRQAKAAENANETLLKVEKNTRNLGSVVLGP